MNIIRAIGQNELSMMKLSEITDHYNRVAKAIGLKAVKKFQDKSTAISRTLDAQETYAEDIAQQAKQVEKEVETKVAEKEVETKVAEKEVETKVAEKEVTEEVHYVSKELQDSVFNKEVKKGRVNKFGLTRDSIVGFTGKCNPKEGTIESSIRAAMSSFFDADEDKFTGTVNDIYDYVNRTHMRQRSEQGVDFEYVVHNIKWFIKKGHFEVIS